MKIILEIPQDEVPKKQGIISVDLHFIEGKVCEAGGYGFSEYQDWIPVKTRPVTEEEKKYFEEYSDYVCEFMWDCPLPMDGQEVLITTKYGEVTTDTFICDGGYGSYFETYSDDGDVLAWMPYPEKFQN